MHWDFSKCMPCPATNVMWKNFSSGSLFRNLTSYTLAVMSSLNDMSLFLRSLLTQKQSFGPYSKPPMKLVDLLTTCSSWLTWGRSGYDYEYMSPPMLLYTLSYFDCMITCATLRWTTKAQSLNLFSKCSYDAIQFGVYLWCLLANYNSNTLFSLINFSRTHKLNYS